MTWPVITGILAAAGALWTLVSAIGLARMHESDERYRPIATISGDLPGFENYVRDVRHQARQSVKAAALTFVAVVANVIVSAAS